MILKFVLEQIGGKELYEVYNLYLELQCFQCTDENTSISYNGNGTLNGTTKLNERQKWFVILLRNHGKGTACDIVRRWGVSVRTARRDIQKLKGAGQIVFLGAKKTGCYRIVEQSKYKNN